MTFEELAKNRYTVRKFSDCAVEKEKLDKILEVGNLAPTAKNGQPHKIYVVQSEEGLAKLNKLTRCIYGAKTVFIFAYDTNKIFKTSPEAKHNSGHQDVSIVATHMMFEAEELGLSTCWVNAFSNEEVEKEMDLPENEKVVLLMPLGYAHEDAKPSILHTTKKDLSEIVSYK
ncbi:MULTISPECIES: nitroreductase family protein [Terrabacteria group]|uniref:nitroreductase family protein n=1 Tax=Bacillati TaxID=1783272 RepID=UPI001C6E852C|nr:MULTISPECIES: nitroreductase family protein [Terrabacteria group]MBW9212581.1 nitroreductase family protein [Trueperella sp. zg.1013]